MLRMTVARGCTPHEAATAKRLADVLAAKFGFKDAATQAPPPPADFHARYARAEKRAARRFNWEYRKCGKPNCHCARGGAHGPYKYAKVREGRVVCSVYLGK